MEHDRAVTVALVLQSKSQIGADICWPLRIAALVGSQVVVVVPASAGATTADVDLTLPDEQPRDVRELATSLREALDANLGEGRWSVGTNKEEDGAPQLEESSAPTMLHIRLQTVPHQQLVKHTLALICKPRSDFLILVTSASDSGDTDWEQTGMDLIRGFTGQGVRVVPGRRRSKGEIVVAASPGGALFTHCDPSGEEAGPAGGPIHDRSLR